MTTITLFEEAVSAGFSSFVGNDESYKISLENYLIERPSTTICVRVKGESMREVGIITDDLVLVDKSKLPKTGDVVIAIIDGNYTIKFLQKDENGKTFLKAANRDFQDIYPENNLEIFGVVVAVIRKYN